VKVLVTGGAGLVAGHLLRLAPAGHEVHLTWRSTPPPEGVPAHRVPLDVDTEVETLFDRVRPDLVVHTAYSQQRADIVDASHHVATACAHHHAQLVHLSTDVVFAGDAPPYAEGDPMEPVTDYGRWKAEAERLVTAALPEVCITRTSLVVSLDPPDAGTRWLLGSLDAGERPVLFRDEHRTPIRATDLATTLWALADLDPVARRGVWHLPGPERLSRLELGRRVLRAVGRSDAEVVEGSVADHPSVRAPDTTLRSRRRPPGPTPRPVP
jgi:dTDP-4-dehydrorhamnose reductase